MKTEEFLGMVTAFCGLALLAHGLMGRIISFPHIGFGIVAIIAGFGMIIFGSHE